MDISNILPSNIVPSNIVQNLNRYENFEYTKPKCRTLEEWLLSPRVNDDADCRSRFSNIWVEIFDFSKSALNQGEVYIAQNTQKLINGIPEVMVSEYLPTLRPTNCNGVLPFIANFGSTFLVYLCSAFGLSK